MNKLTAENLKSNNFTTPAAKSENIVPKSIKSSDFLMERPRDSPDCEALKTCFRLLALSFFVGGFAQAHDSVLLIV